MKNFILCFWLTVPFNLFAQTPHPWEFGLGAGIAAYNGETNKIRLKTPAFGFNPALSLHFRKNISNNFAARVNVLHTRLSGNDKHYTEPAWQHVRGLSFTTALFETAVIGEVYPFGLYKKRDRDEGSERGRVIRWECNQ